MRFDKHIFGGVQPGSQPVASARIGVDVLNEAPVRLTDFFERGAFLKAKNFISLLLGQNIGRARAALPRTRVRMRVFTPVGMPAIRIRCE